MSMRFPVFIALYVIATSALAADVAVRVNVAAPATIEARGETQAKTANVVDGHADLHVAPGVWYLRLNAPGFWADEKVVVVVDAGETIETSMTAYATATITASASFPKNTTAREVTVHFRNDTVQGATQCKVAGEAIQCAIPAQTLDLVFRVAGCASVYRWDVDPKNQGNVGALAFRRGATISGRVDTGDRKIEPAAIDVTLNSNVTTHPNKRGFFSFDVAPGEYRLTASAKGLIAEPRDIRVIEGKEAYLDQPLRLEPPRSVTLRVTPATDPWDKPWTASLIPILHGSAGQARAGALRDGDYRFEQLTTGLYELKIQRPEGGTWYSDILELRDDFVTTVSVPIVNVAGSVLLGDKPTRARLRFVANGIEIPAGTMPDGRFRISLPVVEGNTWTSVEVTAKDAHVHRTLSKVRIDPPSDPASMARLDIHLPLATFGGQVVDEKGNPMTFALVDVTGPDGDYHQIESEDGSFIVTAAAVGKHIVHAQTRHADTERPVEVDIRDENDVSQFIRVVVKPRSSIEGFVRSSFGEIAGASVYVAPWRVPGQLLHTVLTDTAGHFQHPLPPNAQDLVVSVAAPGYAYRLMRTAAGKEPLNVHLDQAGGALEIEVGAEKDGMKPFVIHDGVAMTAWSFAYLSHALLFGDPARRLKFETPEVAPGEYSLCWLKSLEEAAAPPPGRCVSGTVVPQSRLALRFAADESESKPVAPRP